MASIRLRAKVLLRSRSLQFARDYFESGPPRARHTYNWNGMAVEYRPGTSDTGLIYDILLKRGKKSEYSIPPESRLQRQAVSVVLDIGANIGIAALYLASMFPNSTIHAFEPVPENFELLRANARSIPAIKPHAFALGAEDGELTLYDSIDATNFGGFSAHRLGVNTARSKTVPVRHTGRALAALGIDRVDVIKIDTEGSEWEILTAIDPAVLGRTRLIMGELHDRRDFELLDYLRPMFHIGAKKGIKNTRFNFFAVNRETG